MASGTTAQSVLLKISEEHLTCSICCNRFREPKQLDCTHTFCLKCLQNLQKCKEAQDTQLICPLCRRETTLTENGINGLQSNLPLSALVEDVDKIQERLLQGQESEIKCQACNEQAISMCIACVHFMCHKCQRAHERTLKSHKIYTLAEIRSGEIAYKSKLREDVPRCDTHPDQNLSIYCNTCEQMVCTTCSVVSHGNFKHSLVSLCKASSNVSETLEKALCAETKQITAAIHTTDKSFQRFKSMHADTINKISKKAEKETAKIREEELTLRQEVKKIYKERVKKFKVAISKNKQKFLNLQKLYKASQQLSGKSDYEILKLKPTLMHNHQELTGIKSEIMPDSLSFIDFRECEKPLGKLVSEGEPTLESKPEGTLLRPGMPCPKGKWVLKTELPIFGPPISDFGGVYDVGVFSNNEIIMVDRWCQLLSVSLENMSESESPVKRLPIKDLKNPSHVAVNRDDQLVVLDRPAVKTFNKQYQLLHQFTPSGKEPKSTPACLAVDDHNLIAIGYQNTEEISLHKPDGTCIRTLPALLIDEHLTTSKEHLIYTNFKEQKLFSVDYRGGEVSSLRTNSSAWNNPSVPGGPTGVCCSDDGSIYVAVQVRPQGEIHHLTPDGMHIECAIRKCGYPHGIAFTPSGDLVVAAAHSVQVYHHV